MRKLLLTIATIILLATNIQAQALPKLQSSNTVYNVKFNFFEKYFIFRVDTTL